MQDGVRPLTQASIASVAQEVHRLSRLVEDLRLLSLSDLGALTYRKEPLDLDEVIADALAVDRAAIEQKAAARSQLRLDRRARGRCRCGSPGAGVRQPAAEHAALHRQRRPACASAWPWKAARRASTGKIPRPGVGDADLPRLTERLYRVDASRSSASGGSGLGLAIVQAIVQAHGGRMQACAQRAGRFALAHLAAAVGSSPEHDAGQQRHPSQTS